LHARTKTWYKSISAAGLGLKNMSGFGGRLPVGQYGDTTFVWISEGFDRQKCQATENFNFFLTLF